MRGSTLFKRRSSECVNCIVPCHQEENSNLRLQYEQAVAQRESREVEARRFKQLYESEMQWRMRLSDQLQFSSDKALHLKPHLVYVIVDSCNRTVIE